MKQRFKLVFQDIRARQNNIDSFHQQMRKQNTNPNNKYESPRANINMEIDLEKTKTLKRHSYFSGGIKEMKYQNKQAQGRISGVLGQLASYVSEKNGEIPWTKKYDWQQMLVSTQKKPSNNQNEKIERQFMKKETNKHKSLHESTKAYAVNQNNKSQKNHFTSLLSNSNNRNLSTVKIELLSSDFDEKHEQQIIERHQHSKQKQKQHNCFNDSDEFVDFLLEMNKINKTQTFSNYQSLSNNNKNDNQSIMKKVTNSNSNNSGSDSDSEDFDELMMLVEREEKKKREKERQKERQREREIQQDTIIIEQPHLLSQEQQLQEYQNYFIDSQGLSYNRSSPFRSSNLAQHDHMPFQEIDSPIIVRRRPLREFIDYIQSPKSDDDSFLQQQTQSNGGKIAQRYLQSSSEESSNYQQQQQKKYQSKEQKKMNKQQITENKSSSYKKRRLRKQRQQQTTCTICMSEIQQRGKLSCKHDFCLNCIKDWLQKTSSCPICRKDAKYYKHNNQKYKVQQKKYSLQNYVLNIEDDADSYDGNSEEELDYECENCEYTEIEDEILICDRCLVNATHVECDAALGGVIPPEDMNWYCSVCRQSPALWFLQARHIDQENDQED